LAKSQSLVPGLIGVSSTSITLWENKGGRLNLRERSKQALAMAVDLDKSDACPILLAATFVTTILIRFQPFWLKS